MLVTALTTGVAPSITNDLFAESEPADPGGIKINVALLPDISRMEPPFNVKAVVSV